MLPKQKKPGQMSSIIGLFKKRRATESSFAIGTVFGLSGCEPCFTECKESGEYSRRLLTW